jgi:hypothetical protein
LPKGLSSDSLAAEVRQEEVVGLGQIAFLLRLVREELSNLGEPDLLGVGVVSSSSGVSAKGACEPRLDVSVPCNQV